MKKLLIIGCILFGCLAVCVGAAVGAYVIYNRGQAQAKLVVEEGRVQITKGDNSVTVSDSADLYAGDKVTTGESSKASIIYANNSITRLNNNTEVVIAKLEDSGNIINLLQLSGETWSRVQQISGGQEYTIEGNGVVAAVRGTKFNFNMRDTDRLALVSVVKGLVGVHDRGTNSDEQVNADNVALVHRGRMVVELLRDNPVDADWLQFNTDRDIQVETLLNRGGRLLDRLQDLSPRRNGNTGLGFLNLPGFGTGAAWSAEMSREMCASISEAGESLQYLKAMGPLLFGDQSAIYEHVLDLYINACQDGVVSAEEFAEFARSVESLQQ